MWENPGTGLVVLCVLLQAREVLAHALAQVCQARLVHHTALHHVPGSAKHTMGEGRREGKGAVRSSHTPRMTIAE
jgi:hypothetical protein